MSDILNKYIRVAGERWDQLSNVWMLVVEPKEIGNISDLAQDIEMSERAHNRLIRKFVQCHGWTKNKNYKPEPIDVILQVAAKHQGNYREKAISLGCDVYVQESGGYCHAPGDDSDFRIIDECYGYDYPIKGEIGDIVIVENDILCEYKWRNYLATRFPGKEISVLNCFDTRCVEFVKEYIKDAEYVTFSTTFTNFDWFDTLNKSVTNQKIIGYSHDSEKWGEAVSLFDHEIEIVKTLRSDHE